MGLKHTFQEDPPYDDPKNYIDYTENPTLVNANQLAQLLSDANNKRLNQGSNYQTYKGVDTNNFFWHTSTNEAPYLKNIKRGEKMPKVIIND